jgi:predicted AlkP superfamily phosphohydrolase/phosphomutase
MPRPRCRALPSRRRSLVPALALLALVCAAGCSQESAPPEAATTIIGLDGADWRNALPLIRQGKLPYLAALMRHGTRGTMRTNADYRWSPVLWTTIATGKLPEKHGVKSFMTTVPGLERRIPTPSTERTCRALWNIFSERGRSVGFVGWWVTWPAEPVNGFIVSDHFSVSRFDLGRDYEQNVDEPLLQEKQTYPEALAAELQDLKYPRDRVNRDDLLRFANLEDDFAFPKRFAKFDKVSEFAIAHSVDRTHFATAAKLLPERRPELFAVFFQGIDIMQHYFWEFMDPRSTGTDPPRQLRRRYGETIERYYRYTDGLVGAIVEAGGPERAVLLVSDHGFRPATERWEAKGISGEHRRQSFFLFAGPGVRRNVRLDDFDAADVTPTILAYHGLPTARDMDGEPALAALEPEWLARHPVRAIDTYETGEWERSELPQTSVTRDLEERIRALGYIE